MDHFEALRLKNFQPYESFRAEFAPGANTIVGDTDKGKSALIRAVHSVALNGSEASQTTYGKDDCRQQLLVGGHKITRRRAPSTNTYSLDGQEFKAFGTGVPDTISELLQVSDINFQFQTDGFFWLSLSSAERAREINKIFDLGDIDGVARLLNQEHKQAQAEGRVIQARLDAAIASVSELAPAKDADACLRSLEALNDHAFAQASRCNRLREVEYRWGVADTVIAETGESIEAMEALAVVLVETQARRDHLERLRSLAATLTRLDAALVDLQDDGAAAALVDLQDDVSAVALQKARLHRLEAIVVAWRETRPLPMPTDEEMASLEEAVAARSQQEQRLIGLRKFQTQTATLEASIRSIGGDIENLEAEIATVVVCGECGRPL